MASTTIDPLIRIKPSSEMCSFVNTLLDLEREAFCKEPSTLPNGIGSLASCSDEVASKDVILYVEDIKWIFAKNRSRKDMQIIASEIDERVNSTR